MKAVAVSQWLSEAPLKGSCRRQAWKASMPVATNVIVAKAGIGCFAFGANAQRMRSASRMTNRRTNWREARSKLPGAACSAPSDGITGQPRQAVALRFTGTAAPPATTDTDPPPVSKSAKRMASR